MTSPSPNPGTARTRAATIALACAGVFVAYLPVVTVVVSLPAIQRALHATTAELTWVSDAFVLPVAALILTAGVFGDVHGRKKVYQVGLALCAAGALLALCARSVQMLWAGQALAGAGAAALLPVTLALISQAVPNHRERGKYIGLWTTCMMAAMAVPPLIAGVILEHFSWRYIFVLPIPVALVTMVLAARLLEESRAAGGRKLDWAGQATAAVAITALIYGVIEGGASSFTHPRTVAALILAVVSGAAFVIVERRSSSPMLEPSLFRVPAFVASTVAALISFLGLIGFFFVLSLYFGVVQRLSTLESSARMVLVNVVCMALGFAMGHLMRRFSPRSLITAGLLIAAVAMWSLTFLSADTSFPSVAWRLCLLGLGLGLAFPCITGTAVAAVPHHRAGMAAAGNNAFRQVGGALGPALLGALLTMRVTETLPSRLAEAGVTGGQARQITQTAGAEGLGAVAGLDLGAHTGRALGAVGEAFLDGMRLCLNVSAVSLALAAVASCVLLRTRRPAAHTGGAPQEDRATPVTAGDALR
ncbi:EmrB/QacA subfamily drug resistance transporter [Actinocorallia herbida]|uniref:EmrB/QacA subfamily drug resistance transporter n=1 Tax=Actinocorallia herbida TaxID=58109 RepID=A0A3N1D0Y9_9ACTN|nr:MFS transporter [Actinocorallia herbida]ROO87195.1 EmrB/QacA subfamily drug resistance transporter [Actinocorallia herbida]